MSRTATWTVKDFQDREAEISVRLSLPDRDSDAALQRLLGRQRELVGVDQSTVLETIVLNVLTLELHGRSGGLNAQDARRIYGDTFLLLKGNGVKPGSSRLSFVFGRLVRALGEGQRRLGDPLVALCHLDAANYLTYRPDHPRNAIDNLEASRLLLRLGHGRLAAIGTAAALALATTPEEHREVATLRVKALRLSGLADEAREWIQTNPAQESDSAELAWERTALNFVSEESSGPIAARIFRARQISLSTLLMAKLWVLASRSRTVRETAPKAQSLRRRLGLTEEEVHEARNLFLAACRLDEGYDNLMPLDVRLLAIGELFSSRHLLPSVEAELLVLVAAFRHAQHYARHDLAATYQAEYQALCMKLSDGQSKDVLQVRLDAAEKQATTAKVATGFARTRQTLALAAKTASIATTARAKRILASDEERERLKESEAHALGEALVDSLSRLKGGFMKVGQFFSMAEGLPPELRTALSLLRHSATPNPPIVVAAELAKAFPDPDAVFSEFDSQPLAVASIGQVHRAKLRQSGRDVVVKIQHPDVRAAIGSDVKSISFFRPFIQRMMPSTDVKGMLRELAERVALETDFRLEASVQETFRELFRDDPHVVIPQVHLEFSTDTVLTMDFVEGQRYEDFVAQADQNEKNLAGRTIARMYGEALVRHGFFNCDPHPGNYLFLGDGKVAFLDFGCSRRWDAALIKLFLVDTARSVMTNDFNLFVKTTEAIGYNKVNAKFDLESHWQLVKAMYAPLQHDGNFRFDQEYLNRVSALHVESPNLRFASPPPEALMLLRITFGVVNILAELGAGGNWLELLRESSRTSSTLKLPA